MSALLVALSVGCGDDSDPTSTVAPVTPSASMRRGTEVTVVTTGVRQDVDGYGILIDEWDYGLGDAVTVPVPANGTVSLYLREGAHVLSVVGVADNCSGEELDDRPIKVEANGEVSRVLFELVCQEE